MADVLKNIYYGMEDKYYALLDRIDKVVPVYGVIDRIDKVVPSFAIVLAAVIVIVLALMYTLFSGFIVGENITITFVVEDEAKDALPNVNVKLTYLGREEIYTSNQFGAIPSITVPLGTKITYEASRTGYETNLQTVTAENAERIDILLLEERPDFNEVNISLVDSLGALISGEAFLDFECSGNAVAPARKRVINGFTSVTVPSTCGTLLVHVTAPSGYEEVQGFPVSGESAEITLSELPGSRGTVKAQILYNGESVPGIRIGLYREDVQVDEKFSDDLGIAEFKASPATGYVLKTVPTAVYGQKVSDSFSLTAGDVVTKQLVLEKDIKATLEITVEGEGSVEVEDAVVTLKQGNNILESKSTDEDGKVEFSISEFETYTVSVDHPDYLVEEKSINVVSTGTTKETIELTKFTGSNGGVLKVKVVDSETGKGVKNAKVFLYDAETGFLSGYGEKLTDVNGIARFERVVNATYYAFAVKESATGKSDEEFYSIRAQEDFELLVSMIVPTGTIRVKATDEEGKAIDFATVTIYDSFDDSVIGSDLTDSNGTYILPATNRQAKADKTVYVKVSKQGYASYTTIEKQIIANSVQNFSVALEQEILKDFIEVKFLGLYSKEKTALTLAAGEKYNAKFRVKVPKGQNYSNIVSHVRVGTGTEGTGILEKDNVQINKTNTPNANVIRGTSYDPENGEDVDFDSLSSLEAKWANISWNSLSEGVYEFEAEIEIKKTAPSSEDIKVFYRIQGDITGETKRDPLDSSVSEDLYAETYSAKYGIGVSTLCDSDFCFEASIFDKENRLTNSVTESYNGQIFNDYRITFNIINNSSTKVHNNAELRIENADKALDLGSYTLYDASNQEFKGEGKDNKIELLNIGNLEPSNKLSGSIDFRSVLAGNAVLNFKIVSDNRVVFSKDITVIVSALNELKVEAFPKELPAGIENTIDVNVFDARTGLEVEEATLRIKDRFDNTLTTAVTDRLGNAHIVAPALFPGEELTLEAEKQNYNLAKVSLKANDEVLAISPSSISTTLNATLKQQSEEFFTLENKTNFSLTLTSIEYTGNSHNLLNEDSINNWLASYNGIVLDETDSQRLSFKSFLSTEGLAVEDREQLKGEIVVNASNFGKTWQFKIPVNTTIGVGAELDNEDCLQVTVNSWNTATEGSTVEKELSIKNNCTIAGSTVALNDLEVEADWQSNQLGEFTLSLYEGSNAIAAVQPQKGYFKKLVSEFPAETSYSAILQFTPFGGDIGTAKANINIRAKNKTEDAKDQITEQTIAAEISVINLQKCISYSKEIIIINKLSSQTDAESSFTVSNKEGCGEIEIQLESDLELSLTEFTVQQGSTSPTIQVLAGTNNPGQYPIFVKAKALGQKVESELTSTIKENEFIRVRIYNTDDCIQLDRYEFDVFLDPNNTEGSGFEEAELKNNCYEQEVPVKVDMKSWSNALKEGLRWGLITLAIGLVVDHFEEGGSIFGGSGSTGSSSFQKTGTYSVEGKEYSVQQGVIDGKTYMRLEDGTTYVLENNNWKKYTGSGLDWSKSAKVSSGSSLPSTLPADSGTKTASDISTDITDTLGTAVVVLAPTGSASLGDLGILQYVLPGSSSFLGGFLGASPWSQAFGVFLISALSEYTSQGVLEFSAIKPALELSALNVLNPDLKDRPVDTDVSVAQVGERELEASSTSKLDIEKRGIRFENISGFTGTLFKLLQVEGYFHEYKEKTYSVDDVADSGFFESVSESDIDVDDLNLEETSDSPKYSQSLFHLQFNAINPSEVTEPTVETIIDCKSFAPPGLSGTTGENAVPRILLNWNWNAIDFDSCDQGNEDYIYCDATQFSIAVLKKTEKIREFLENNKDVLECPSIDSKLSTIENIIPTDDIGISKLSVQKLGLDANIIVEITNTGTGTTPVELTVTAANGAKKTCTRSLDVLSKATASCLFEDLDSGEVYAVNATIEPDTSCNGCVNGNTNTDSATTTFQTTSSGITECQPYDTTRLDDFIQATEASGSTLTWPDGINSKDEMIALTHFNAYLIQDRYSTDFQKDFDNYSHNVSFFNAPSYYTESQGLSELFKDSSIWRFAPKFGSIPAEGYLLPKPGLYEIDLKIEFGNENWNFFENSQADANVRILLNKSPSDSGLNSPFYYLPFDGLIGTTDSDNGRTGYGVNFAGDIVSVNTDPSQELDTTGISSSTPFRDSGTISVAESEDFKKLNVTDRGIILDLTQTAIDYSPSYATPMILNVYNDTGDSAYAFYNFGLDGAETYEGESSNPWWGIGTTCKDFKDRAVKEAFNGTLDESGINTDCALTTGLGRTYGIEWCDTLQNSGNVFLKTVFYTPQGKDSSLNLVVYSDNAKFIGEEVEGQNGLPLNGVSGIPSNSLSDNIESIEDILDLVKNRYVCVSGSSDNAKFYWNPAKVLEVVQEKEESLAEQCIE